MEVIKIICSLVVLIIFFNSTGYQIKLGLKSGNMFE